MGLCVSNYYDTEIEILAGNRSLKSPIHMTINPDYIQPDADGNKHILPGTWWMGPREGARPLPRTRVADGFPSGAAGQSFTVGDASIFQVGEELVAAAPWMHINFTPNNPANWAAGETVTLTIDGYNFVYTLSQAYTDNALLSAEIGEAINADPYLSQIVGASSYAADPNWDLFINALAIGSVLSIAVGTDSAAMNVQTQSLATELIPFQSIGDIDRIDVDTNTLTLAAPPPAGFPPGYPIGVPTSKPILGMTIRHLDLSECHDDLIQGVYVSASVYEERLPYDDADLKKRFPEIIRC